MNGTVRTLFLCLLAAGTVLPVPARTRGPSRRAVKVGFFQSRSWARLDSDGTRRGIIPEWTAELARRCKWEVKWVHSVWSRAFDQLASGELDMIVGVAPSKARQDRFLFPSTPFMLFPSYLFVLKDGPYEAKTVQGLDGARIGLVKGYWHNGALANYLSRKGARQWKPVMFNTADELDQAFAAGKVDAALGDVTDTLASGRAVPLIAFPAMPLFSIVSPRRPDLIADIEIATADVLLNKPEIVHEMHLRNLRGTLTAKPLIDIASDPDLGRAMVALSRSHLSEQDGGPLALLSGDARLDRGFALVLVILSLISVAGMLLFLKLYRRARTAMRARTGFLSLMSHEIRTPLNAVVGFSECIGRPGLSQKEIAAYAKGIGESSQALLALVNDILDLSKLEANRMDVLDGTCDCARVFADISDMFTPKFREKGVAFTCHANDVPVLGFRESCLRQVLLNLVGNAYKFTEEGAVSCTAGVSPEEDGRATFILVVRDTGEGIAPDALEAVFDPFVQAASTQRDRFTQGTGLGLAIVQRLVDAAGGSVDVRSELGKGSAFVVRIPGLRVCGRTDGPAPAARPPAETGTPTPRGVLVVDDVPLNRKILLLHLRTLGFTDVRTAGSGVEAVAEMEKSPADIVLSDIWMPGMDGAELSRVLAARWPGVPAIAITADTDAAGSFDTSNFRAVLTKPITADALGRAIASCGANGKE